MASCGWNGYEERRDLCISTRVFPVEERDGGLFAGAVRVFTCDCAGRLEADTCDALQVCNHARLITCRVCGGRFIGHRARHGCSDTCRKVIAQRALEKHRQPPRTTEPPKPRPKRARVMICGYCWKRFEPKRSSREFCSDACRQAAYRERRRA
jgi:hypothetical protein